jgi:hypothetical protein
MEKFCRINKIKNIMANRRELKGKFNVGSLAKEGVFSALLSKDEKTTIVKKLLAVGFLLVVKRFLPTG